MTETEIMKATECCKNGDCVSCPLSSNRYESKCKDILFEAVIDFMNGKNEIITEAKMTEAEIMKALEICSQNDTNKHYMMTYNGMPLHILFEAVIDLLNRKNAEIDDLIKENIRLERELRKAIMPNGMTAVTLYEAEMRGAEMIAKHDAEIRAEAIKEVLQRVKKLIVMCYYDLGDLEDTMSMEKDLDQIAKEMGVEL